MRSFLRIVFVLFLFSFHQEGNATRYHPSIVWDYLNPMLSCKCNWFNPIALIEIYDRFELVCPTTRIHTVLLAKHSRPEDLMNLNIFQRKWKGGIDSKGMNELKRQMMSGEFCDPTHNDTAKIFTCKMGASEGQTIRFAGDAGFYPDDIVVYFNNANDGRKTSLESTDKSCAMAFVTRVTWNVAKKYDFTYGKNLDELLPQCDDVNTTCKEEGSTPCTSTPPSIPPSTTIEPNQTATTSNESNEKISSEMPTTSQSTTKSTTDGNDTSTTPSAYTTSSIGMGNSASRGSEDNDLGFTYGFLAGFATLLILIIVAAFIYRLLCGSQKRKKRKTNDVCQYKVGDQNQSTTINNVGAAEPLPNKTPLSNNNNQGINNIGFKRETLERVDSPA